MGRKLKKEIAKLDNEFKQKFVDLLLACEKELKKEKKAKSTK